MRVQPTICLLAAIASGCSQSAGASDSGAADADRRDAAAIDASSPEGGAASSDAGLPRPERLYVGQDDGELVAHTIGPDGTLAQTSRSRVGMTPSFVAMGRDPRFAYAVSDRDGEIVALAIDPATGAATRINARPSGGGAPTHVTLDPAGTHVLAANYEGGSVRVYPIEADGALGPPSDTESAGANAHAVYVDPSSRWALVPCLGIDRVVIYAYDAGAGTLSAHGGYETAPGAGPRHLAIEGDRIYVLNERDSSLDALAFDAGAGTLAHLQTISTLPDAFSGRNTAAEVFVHPQGAFVYASNRGHDSIAAFAIEPDGRLRAIGHGPLMARTPRSFAITEDGARLYAGAQGDDRVVRFAIAADGTLRREGATDVGAAPVFVGVFGSERR